MPGTACIIDLTMAAKSTGTQDDVDAWKKHAWRPIIISIFFPLFHGMSYLPLAFFTLCVYSMGHTRFKKRHVIFSSSVLEPIAVAVGISDERALLFGAALPPKS